jgi:hypothetical protein
MANILILYDYRQYPVRATVRDHLYSFKKYSSHRCFYLNVGMCEIPWYVKKISWDLIIFHTIFLSSRWTRELFVRNTEKVRFLKYSNAIKVALPQDEFLNTDLVCDFINEFGIDHVFSVASEAEWPVIYRTVDSQKVKFHKVLTGYMDDSLINKVSRIAKSMPVERPIDIGYRAYRAAFWLGQHGALKWLVADVFKEKAPQRGLVVDISTRDEDVIPGDNWYRFLLRCKYQLGVEGGASILDWDGTYRKKTEEYLAQHPQATFEEVEKACFPGAEGSLRLHAISPRHFECCLTKTCQVLVEGDYDGVLAPGKHYIELKRDFSNLDEVLDIIARDELRGEITARAWQDIVESRNYTYRGFVDYVIKESLGRVALRSRSPILAIWNFIVYYWALLEDEGTWFYMIPAEHSHRRLVPFLLYHPFPGRRSLVFFVYPLVYPVVKLVSCAIQRLRVNLHLQKHRR